MDLNGGGILIGRVRGIAIRVHWTWLAVFALVSWNLQSTILRDIVPEWNDTQRWFGAFAAALVFFGSVLLHELSHAFVAQHYQMKVPSITLFVLGGVSNIEGEMRTAGQEFRIAIAGPLMSVVLGLLMGVLWWVLPADGPSSAVTFISGTMMYLGGTNIMLGIFNLIPGYPLDGGRVLRAIFWASSGDLTKSTRIATRSGAVLAWGMIGIGIALSLTTRSLSGVWFVLIGLFLKTAAESAYGQMILERALDGVSVRDVMRPAPEPVDASANLMRVVQDRVIGRGERAVFVGTEGRVRGLFTVSDLASIPNERLSSMTARDVMVAAERIITVIPSTPLLDATRAMTERDVHQLPVVEDGRMVGVLSRGDVLQRLETRQRLAESGK